MRSWPILIRLSVTERQAWVHLIRPRHIVKLVVHGVVAVDREEERYVYGGGRLEADLIGQPRLREGFLDGVEAGLLIQHQIRQLPLLLLGELAQLSQKKKEYRVNVIFIFII